MDTFCLVMSSSERVNFKIKKSCPILYCYSLYRIGQDFLDIQYSTSSCDVNLTYYRKYLHIPYFCKAAQGSKVNKVIYLLLYKKVRNTKEYFSFLFKLFNVTLICYKRKGKTKKSSLLARTCNLTKTEE